MPMYEHRCPVGHLMTSVDQDANRLKCAVCSRPMTRLYGFYTPKQFQEGFNHSVGAFVSSEQQLKEELKRAAGRAEDRSGIPTTYEMVGPSEGRDAGVTEELPHAVSEKWLADS